MAQTFLTLASTQHDGVEHFNEWLRAELLARIEYNMTTRETWRLLRDQDSHVGNRVLQVLEAYTTTWNTPAPGKDSSATTEGPPPVSVERHCNTNIDMRDMIDLFTAAEEDFEKGLAFVREVEKGSHIKPTTIPMFRPEAISELCRLSQERLAASTSRGGFGTSQHVEMKPPTNLKPSNTLSLDDTTVIARCQQRRDVLHQVYKSVEKEFQQRLRALVAKYKALEKKAKKR